MFPLYDQNPRQSLPAVTLTLIGLNLLVFLREVTFDPDALEAFIARWGMIPVRLQDSAWASSAGLPEGGWSTLLTCTFLHGGWMHLIGNMWMLWLFGDNIEDRFGHARFAIFYLLCGVGASLVHYLVDPGSTVPTIGASGAVAGVMGAYFLLFPRARVVSLVILVFFIDLWAVPAWVYLGLWLLIQVWSGTTVTASGVEQGGGVAFWAHVGGFGVGALLLLPMMRGRRWPPRQPARRRVPPGF